MMRVALLLLATALLGALAAGAASAPARLFLQQNLGPDEETRFSDLSAGCTEYPMPCTGLRVLACDASVRSGPALAKELPTDARSETTQDSEQNSKISELSKKEEQEFYLVGLDSQLSAPLLASWGLRLLSEELVPSCRVSHVPHAFAVVSVQSQLDLEPFLRSGAIHRAIALLHYPHASERFAASSGPERSVNSSSSAAEQDNEEKLIRELLERIENQEYRFRLEELSGERSFPLDGRDVVTKTRYTYAPQHKLNAAYSAKLFKEEFGADEAFLQPFTLSGQATQNVVAVKRGVETPERIFVVGAHYDSTSPQASTLAPGAVDNGSGSAGILAIARALAPYRFRSTIHFVLFGGEEQGLHGSAYYVRDAQSRGLNVVSALTMDMIAYSKRFFGVTIEGTRNEAISRLMDGYAAEVRRHSPKLSVNLSYQSFGSDHVSFQRAGIPAILAIEQDDTEYPGYHRTTDTIAYANIDQSVAIVRPLAALLAKQAGILG